MSGKKITAAIVIINADGSILGCHAFGRPKETGYDFPKGLVEEGEADLEAAIRELGEEAGIYLTEKERNSIIDAGIHKHNKEKHIHIFILKVNEFPNLSSLKCTSFFELHGKQYPEVDSYKIIPKSERNQFNKVLQDKFELIDSFNE